ncbi:hypothetical protein [Pseudomonas quasicaspiana]|uniref:hypothetical protein n=1 Tax=Pseudomonas quasicaspiana TaxID=2829821 RepID=UPI001E31A7C0|nr:hypothetical protein [Pseudomonas quasicaspiana]MCD5975164.1 hypothetical protein [Pseudomonas quasicaspiana]
MVDSIRSHSPQLQLTQAHHDSDVAQGSRQPQQATPVKAITNPRERANVMAYMDDLFKHYEKRPSPNASPAERQAVTQHNASITRLARSRAERLLREGEDEASIRKTMDNAHRLDRYTTTGTSLVGGLPFTGMVAAQFAKPEVVSKPTQYLFGEIENAVTKAAAEGGVGGMEAHYPDEFFQRLFQEAKDNSFFLKAPADKLHAEVADSLSEKNPGKLKDAMEDARQIQTYLVRAVATNVTSAVLTATNNAQHVETFNKVAVPVGNYLAGVATAHLKHSAQNGRHERGEALLFALKDAEPKENLDDEEDWLNVYNAAKNGSIFSALGHGGERMGNMLLGATSNSLDALGKALTSANSLGGGYLGLGATFAARGAAQQYATDLVSGPIARSAVGGTVNTIGTATAFGIWAFVASLSSKLSDEGKAWMSDDNHAAPKAAATEAARGAGAYLSRQLQEGYESASNGVSNLRQRNSRPAGTQPADIETQAGAIALENTRATPGANASRRT